MFHEELNLDNFQGDFLNMFTLVDLHHYVTLIDLKLIFETPAY